MSNDNLVKAIEALMRMDLPAPLEDFGFRLQNNAQPYVFGYIEGRFVSVEFRDSSAQTIAASLIEKSNAMKASIEAPRSIADAEFGQHFAVSDAKQEAA